MARANCAEGINELHVYLSGPGYNGSGVEQPYAEGVIVSYNVTAVPESGETITVGGSSVLDGGWVSLSGGSPGAAPRLQFSAGSRRPGPAAPS